MSIQQLNKVKTLGKQISRRVAGAVHRLHNGRYTCFMIPAVREVTAQNCFRSCLPSKIPSALTAVADKRHRDYCESRAFLIDGLVQTEKVSFPFHGIGL
jgi:hypothetical protein